MIKIFINLTNGIEAIPALADSGESFSFIRIQSTTCEQKDWDRLILDLDNNFFMHLALGYECIVYDFGAHKPTARAIYQGLEFVRYATSMCWLGEAEEPLVRGNKCGDYFLACYRNLTDRTKKKLKYYRTFFRGTINLKGISAPTPHDNDKNFYKEIIDKYMTNEK